MSQIKYFHSYFHVYTTIALVSIGLQSAAADGGSTDPTVLRLHDAHTVVATALAGNQWLHAARWEIDRAAGRLDQSGRMPNPELGATVLTDRPFGNEGELGWDVSLSQAIPLTSRLRRARNLSRAELATAEAELAEARRDLAVQAVEIWRNAVEAHTRFVLAKAQQSLLQEQLEYSRDAAGRGELSSLSNDQLVLESQVAEMRLQTIAGERERELDKLRLVLGIDADRFIDLPQADTKSGTNPSHMDGSDVKIDSIAPVQSAQARLTAASAGVDLARSQQWDDITISVIYSDERGIDEPLGLKRDQFLGIGFSLPLPIWDRKTGLVNERLAARRGAEALLHAERQQARHAIATAHADAVRLAQIKQNLESGPVQSAQRLSARMHEARKTGEVSIGDVIRAREQQLTVEDALTRVTMDYLRALDRYHAAAGLSPFADFR